MIDTDRYEETDHPELVEFEGETLGDTLTNLLVEVKRLREENIKLRKFLENIEWGLSEINNEYKEIKKVIE
jgi:hypothetical protein|tara:strand:- start:8769 stop:8981 length:213 start_codon:yes stop_codon:yes gene_type:complete